MMENKYPYDNWKSITESDFVTLFIKTWFAFVSTLREMYPAEIPYYQATGDSRYISPYKRDFSQNIAYRLNYTDIKYHLYEVYKHGMKIIADRYPRFIKCYKSKLFKLRIWCRTQTAFPDADNQLPSKYRRWKRDDLSR